LRNENLPHFSLILTGQHTQQKHSPLSGWLPLKKLNRQCKEFSQSGFSGGTRGSYRKKRWVVRWAYVSCQRKVPRPCHTHNLERTSILQYYNTY